MAETTTSLEDQRRIYQEANLNVMNWLEERGTLIVAKKFFASWLLVAEGGELDLYSDEITPQDLAQQLSDNSNYFLSVDRERGRTNRFTTWFNLCFDNQVFIKPVTVGKVSATPSSTVSQPFYYRGFDAFDLGYVKVAAERLEALRNSGVPNLSQYLDGVEKDVV